MPERDKNLQEASDLMSEFGMENIKIPCKGCGVKMTIKDMQNHACGKDAPKLVSGTFTPPDIAKPEPKAEGVEKKWGMHISDQVDEIMKCTQPKSKRQLRKRKRRLSKR